MNKLIYFFKNIIDYKTKKKFFLLQLFYIISGLLELISISTFVPLISLILNKNLIRENEIFLAIFNFSNISNEKNFIIFLSLICLFLLLFSNILKIVLIYFQTFIAFDSWRDISYRYLNIYLSKKSEFLSNFKVSSITNNLIFEIERTTIGIAIPFVDINSKIILTIIFSISILLVNPYIFFILFILLTITYILIYFFIRTPLYRFGKVISKSHEEVIKLVSDIFNNIKILILFNKKNFFLDKIDNLNKNVARVQTYAISLSQFPRLVLEVILLTLIVFVSLYFFLYEHNILKSAPQIIFISILSFKLLPIFQQIFVSISKIRSNIAALDNIIKDLSDTNLIDSFKSTYEKEKNNFKSFKKIEIKNLTFKYDNNLIFSNFSLNINQGDILGIYGKSGSGKSTLVEIIFGLIESKKSIFIDKKEINNENKKDWQKVISYCPQNTFLFAGSLQENIAFGSKINELDIKKVIYCLEMVDLNEFATELKNGNKIQISDLSSNISGGQKQKIGIARALYRNSSFLVFDESFSNIDIKSYMKILNNIFNIKDKTILIISHDMNLLKMIDNLIDLEDIKYSS